MNTQNQTVKPITPISDPISDQATYISPKKCLGASQFATALGLNIFQKPQELKERLEKGYYQEKNDNIIFGHQMENVARYFYIKITKNKVKKAPFVHDQRYHRIVGICDGLVGDKGGLEIKCHYHLSKTFLFII